MKLFLLSLVMIPIMTFSQGSNCDSIAVQFTGIDSSGNFNMVDFDFQTYHQNNATWFLYAGFVLTTNAGDTIAYETIETSGSHFGFGGNWAESRNMVLLEDIDLPFDGQIKLMEGWFAGGNQEVCSLPFEIPATVLSIDDETIDSERTLLKITDCNGRIIPKKDNELQFYHYDDGSIEKVILTK